MLPSIGRIKPSIARLMNPSSPCQDDECKVKAVDDNLLFGCIGPSADRSTFLEYIEKCIHLYRLRNGIKLNVKAAANFTRWDYGRRFGED